MVSRVVQKEETTNQCASRAASSSPLPLLPVRAPFCLSLVRALVTRAPTDAPNSSPRSLWYGAAAAGQEERGGRSCYALDVLTGLVVGTGG